jgi:hypothetical protein
MNPKIKAIVTELRQYLEKLYGDRLLQMAEHKGDGQSIKGTSIKL